ncbi:hypothetical protein NAT51_05435 [Flavobacterium amniphilum]|uniref:hypothetical protein n=1 Tax=Flavobacterium amniphilum TaxID=1834035 RepID=UPI00202A3E93|nr:hypothetical protein [Flavobacterium amniphilum]MCL9804949.1 hypothetical protein [Flavobacterium amniphilum]
MKYLHFIFILLVSATAYSQEDMLIQYNQAESQLKSGNTAGAYTLFKELYPKVKLQDTLYNYTLWYYVGAANRT